MTKTVYPKSGFAQDLALGRTGLIRSNQLHPCTHTQQSLEWFAGISTSFSEQGSLTDQHE